MTNHESGNRVIAEFAGAEWKKDDYGEYGFFFPDNSHRPTAVTALKYHTSLDWIIAVVEKIKELGYNVEIIFTKKYNVCRIYRGEDKTVPNYAGTADTVFEAATDFIEWYNTQKTITHA